MKFVSLTQGKYTIVDDEDWEKTLKFKWIYAPKANQKGYAQRAVTISKNKRTTLRLHRYLLGLSHGDGIIVDHANGNTLDNRKQNLRICSSSENSVNKDYKIPTSGYRGVIKKRNKYYAVLERNGKIYSKGGFNCPTVAAIKYDKLAKEINGEFCRLSFGAKK